MCACEMMKAGRSASPSAPDLICAIMGAGSRELLWERRIQHSAIGLRYVRAMLPISLTTIGPTVNHEDMGERDLNGRIQEVNPGEPVSGSHNGKRTPGTLTLSPPCPRRRPSAARPTAAETTTGLPNVSHRPVQRKGRLMMTRLDRAAVLA
jgi:hypothetical protein